MWREFHGQTTVLFIFVLRSTTMPGAILHGVLAVGMSHYSGKLTVGTTYRLRREKSNTHDLNAVAITENLRDARQICGHLKRDAALSSNGVYYLKTTGAPYFHLRRSWVQVCHVGFPLKEADVDRAREIVLDQGFRVTYKP